MKPITDKLLQHITTTLSHLVPIPLQQLSNSGAPGSHPNQCPSPNCTSAHPVGTRWVQTPRAARLRPPVQWEWPAGSTCPWSGTPSLAPGPRYIGPKFKSSRFNLCSQSQAQDGFQLLSVQIYLMLCKSPTKHYQVTIIHHPVLSWRHRPLPRWIRQRWPRWRHPTWSRWALRWRRPGTPWIHGPTLKAVEVEEMEDKHI